MTPAKISWWQRCLSYFKEVPIETVEGTINPVLQVSLVQNRFQLSTNNAIYSFDDLYLNFERAFKKMELPPNQSSLLLLGLGLGSVPFILEKKHNLQYYTTAIELDEAIISLASQFTFPRLTHKIEVIHADAEIYVKTTSATYDFIILDLFLDDVVPPYFESESGIRQLSFLLNDGGLLLVNRLFRNRFDKKRTKKFFEGPFSSVFRGATYIDVGGNWILMARRTKSG